VRKLAAAGDVTRATFEVACATLFVLFVGGFFFDARNVLLSGRPVLERFATEVPRDAPLAIYGRLEPEVLYWIDREPVFLEYPDPKVADDPRRREIDAFLRRPAAAYVVTTKEELRALRQQFASLGPLLNVRDQGLAGRDLEYVLVSNRP
jgi:hypothetical protein